MLWEVASFGFALAYRNAVDLTFRTQVKPRNLFMGTLAKEGIIGEQSIQTIRYVNPKHPIPSAWWIAESDSVEWADTQQTWGF